MRNYIQLMRPHQYIKNLLIFFPAFFGFYFFHTDVMLRTGVVFLGFCMMASAVYIMNDYQDREDDRKHPEKSNRPLAAGTVSPSSALTLMAGLFFTGLIMIGAVNTQSLYFTLIYFVLNIAYTFRLKHIAVVDIVVLALGFVLRLYIGAQIGGIELSMWINLMTFLLALFLGLAKRRTDVLLAEEGHKVRRAIDGYNLEFINAAMTMMASVVVVAYIFYTISPEIQTKYSSQYLYLTVIFVLLGILRYMQITFVEQKSGNPSKVLLKDLFLQLTILGWVATFFVMIYVNK